jgi:hypothetical protein
MRRRKTIRVKDRERDDAFLVGDPAFRRALDERRRNRDTVTEAEARLILGSPAFWRMIEARRQGPHDTFTPKELLARFKVAPRRAPRVPSKGRKSRR